jgi:hypothetical protein
MKRCAAPAWLLLFCAVHMLAQQPTTIHVLLLNGNNGKPLDIGNNGKSGAPLSLVISPNCGSAGICFFPDKRYGWGVDGGGHLELPIIPKLQSVVISRPTSQLMYCQGTPDKYGALDRDPEFSVDEILRHGIVAPNTCDTHLNIKPQPGQLIFFLRPLSWWEQLMKPPQM